MENDRDIVSKQMDVAAAPTRRVAASIVLATRLSPDRTTAGDTSDTTLPPTASFSDDLVVLHKYVLPPNHSEICAKFAASAAASADVVSHDGAASTSASVPPAVVYVYSGTAKKFQMSFVPCGQGVMEMYPLAAHAALSGGVSEASEALKPLVTYTGAFHNGDRHGLGLLVIFTPDDAAAAVPSSAASSPTVSSSKRAPPRPPAPTAGFSLRCRWDNNMPDVLTHPCVIHSSGDEYVGMVSIISNITSRAGYSGLVWTRTARFLPDSTGEMLYSDRRRYCGEWQCGQRHGFGIEFDPLSNTTFIGGFQYDSRDGSGTLLNETLLTVFSGVWREGVMSGSAGLNINRKANTIQGHNWNVERYEFDSATILRSRVVNGVWEPLFVAFDNTLALSATELLTQSEDLDAMQLLAAMMEKPDFTSVIATFQRCFFFLYGACAGNDAAERPESVEALSWCFHTGLMGHCFHGSVRERTSTQETFSRAVADISSFVFSVRLRLLSFVAAHPKACDVNVSREVLRVCWDRVFSLVAPVLTHLSLSQQRRERAALHLACRRCQNLQLADFLGESTTTEMVDDDSSGRETERGEKRLRDLCEEFSTVIGGSLTETLSTTTTTSSGPLILFPSFTTVTEQLRFLFKAKQQLKGDERALMFLIMRSNSDYLLPHLRTVREVLSGTDPKFPAPSFVLCQSALSYEALEESSEDDVVALELVNLFLHLSWQCSSAYPQLRHHPSRAIWPLDVALTDTCAALFRIVNVTGSAGGVDSKSATLQELEKRIAEVSVDEISASEVLLWVLERTGAALHAASAPSSGTLGHGVGRGGEAVSFRRSVRLTAGVGGSASQLHFRGVLSDAEQQQVHQLIVFLRQLKIEATFDHKLQRGDDDGESSPVSNDGGWAFYSCICDPELPPLVVRSFAVVWDACVLRIGSSRRSSTKRKI